MKTTEYSGEYNKNFAYSSDLSFTYEYDRSNRLLEAVTQDNKFEITNSYDKDGNILTLDRKGSAGSSVDDFNYSYYNGTNKISRVQSIKDQFVYDSNGNLITDSLNSNFSIHYDHRNLITDLIQRVILVSSITPADTSFYKTYYYYDESGNRIRKKIYDDKNDSLLKDIVYSRDLNGKEMVIYENGSIKQWNIWGTDNAGFINSVGDKRYYLKDHLGSVRAVIDDGGSLVSAQDYDAWGYQLQDRSYNSEESVYKFTSKERDEENKYDYFGARYYDARVGRWGGVDKMQEERLAWSPYNYVLDNPLNKTDLNGLLDRPIYDIWGSFLGTDDQGLQGDAIIMNKENFVQGMSPESAASYDLGFEGLSGVDAQMKFSNHYESIPNRPDYDGYLTLDEANEWYQTGSGEPLFTSLEKIDLSGIYSLGETYVGDERSFNLFLNSNTLNDALVYGSITLKRYSGNQVRAYSDKYNFEMHNILDPTNLPRNIATLIGKNLAGEGKTFNINIYGSKKLEPLFPWTK